MTDLSEEEFQALYAWVDEIPLSRQKKNVARDFSDGGKGCTTKDKELSNLLLCARTQSCSQIMISSRNQILFC